MQHLQRKQREFVGTNSGRGKSFGIQGLCNLDGATIGNL
jgi:hypothetical protein